MKKKLLLFSLSLFLTWNIFGYQRVLAEESDYAIVFTNNEENKIQLEMYKTDNSLVENIADIKFENLKLFEIETNTFIQFSFDNDKGENIKDKLNLLLLESGLAQIVDESVATKSEIDAQEKAKKQHVGGWGFLTDSNSEDMDKEEKTSVWVSLRNFFYNNYQFLISVMVGGGLFAAVFKKIYKLCHTRRKRILLAGANATGKTTLRNTLLNPDVSLDDLMHSSPTLRVVEERVIRDEANQKVSLTASIIDPPGHELSHSIDNLSKYNEKIFSKYVVIIILAPCKGYSLKQAKYDDQYIADQYQTLKKLWIPLLQARSTIMPERVILFINKRDLFQDDEHFDLRFEKHKDDLEKVCKSLGINVSVIKGSVLKKIGMTELMRLLRK